MTEVDGDWITSLGEDGEHNMLSWFVGMQYLPPLTLHMVFLKTLSMLGSEEQVK